MLLSIGINAVEGGVTWYEVANVYDCKEHWWTVLTFTNDVIPYFVKDFRGCMRFASLIAIEMKFILVLPILVQLYHKGLKALAISICLLAVVVNFVVSGLLYEHYQIAPSNLSLLDPVNLDLFLFKPWSYIAAYSLGVLMGFFFQEYKYFKFEATEEEKSRRPVFNHFYTWVAEGRFSNYILFTLSIQFFFIWNYILHFAETFYSSVLVSDHVTGYEITQDLIDMNAFYFTVGRIFMFFGVICTSLWVF